MQTLAELRKEAREKGWNLKTIQYRRRVFNGTLDKTPGGLRRGDLEQKPDGRIVSKKASAAAMKKYKQDPERVNAILTKGQKKLGTYRGDAKPKPNCSKGKSCGRACIRKKYTCRKSATKK